MSVCVCEVDNVDQDGNPIRNSEDSSRGLMGGRLHDVCVCLGVCVLGVCVCILYVNSVDFVRYKCVCDLFCTHDKKIK